MAIEVSTTDEVRFRLEIAGIGSRVLAYTVDSGIKYGFMLVLIIVFHLFRPGWIFDLGVISTHLLILIALAILFVQWAYYWLFEWLWHGQTPGKRLMGIRVIRDNGQPPGVAAPAVRNLLRVVDLPGVGLLLMFAHARGKRLGDIVAGTLVVYKRRLALDAYDTAAEESGEAAAQVTLTANQYGVLTEYARRREAMTEEARAELAERLAGMLAAAGAGRHASEDAEHFVERILENARVGRDRTNGR